MALKKQASWTHPKMCQCCLHQWPRLFIQSGKHNGVWRAREEGASKLVAITVAGTSELTSSFAVEHDLAVNAYNHLDVQTGRS